MILTLAALGIILLGGLLSLVLPCCSRAATRVGAGSVVIGSLTGLPGALQAMLGAPPVTLTLPWSLPIGAIRVGMDPLSGFFLCLVYLLGGLAAIYGAGYLEHARHAGTLPRAAWWWYSLLVASLAAVFIARDAVLFLISWEIMSVSSWFLVTQEDEREEVRKAGWIYLAATHLGTAFLFILFLLMVRAAGGSTDFAAFTTLGAKFPAEAGVWFALALVGFGTKAGLVPLHPWLPEAHPAAPSHVSAVMSGVMLKTGLYGLLRCLVFTGPLSLAWGWALVGIGLISALYGVANALAQRDLKRALAYSSIENMGIALLGVGLGIFGLRVGYIPLAVFGLAAALFHAANHTLFKGLLFLGAGSILHGCGTRNLERMGGLLARMPGTGAAFFVGCLAISGLPPLNGFAGEFLLYIGAFRGVQSLGSNDTVPAVFLIAGLALVGGLAAACFTRLFGIAFSGEPRSEEAAAAHESGPCMRIPLYILAALCILAGLFSPAIVRALLPAVRVVSPMDATLSGECLELASGPLQWIALLGFGLALTLGLLLLLRRRLGKHYPEERFGTWDCGYAAPTPRMQYSADSYSRPLTELLGMFTGARRPDLSRETFAAPASFHTVQEDPAVRRFWSPVFSLFHRAFGRLLPIQSGSIHLYVLYIAAALLVLLVWKLQ